VPAARHIAPAGRFLLFRTGKIGKESERQMIDNSFRIAALREGVHEKPHPAGDRPLRIAAALALAYRM